MLKDYLNFVVSFFIISFCPFQADAASQLTIHRLDATQFPIIKAYLSVSHNGKILEDLSPSDFKVYEGKNRPIIINNVITPRELGEKVAMVVAVDTSGSMQQNQLQIIKQAITKMIGNKAENDLIALISFNDSVFVNCPFTKDAEVFLNKLNTLKIGGRITVLFEAIFKGLEMFDSPDLPIHRYLVVLSDGYDEGEAFTLDDDIDKAKQVNVPVYSLGFVSKVGDKHLGNMVRLSKSTNGEYREVATDDDIIAAYTSIAGKTLKQQVLELEADFIGDGDESLIKISFIEKGAEICKANATFKTPFIKKKTQNNNMPSTPIKKKNELIEGVSNQILLSIIGLTLVFLLIIIFLVVRRGRRRSVNNAEFAITNDSDISEGVNANNLEIGSQSLAMQPSQTENKLFLDIPCMQKVIELSSRPMTIGAYSDNDLVIDEITVSGYHAMITKEGDQWLLKDADSTNGTRLNGEYIKEPVFIKQGDEIKIGPVSIKVKI